MNRELKYGCRKMADDSSVIDCKHYIGPEKAGIGGAKMFGKSGGRCILAKRKMLNRLVACPLTPPPPPKVKFGDDRREVREKAEAWHRTLKNIGKESK